MKTIEELESRQTEIRSRLQEIDNEHSGEAFPSEARKEWNELNDEKERNDELLTELRARRDRVEELSGSESNREDGAAFHVQRSGVARGEDIYDLTTIRSTVAAPDEAVRELNERAKRALDNSSFPHEDAEEARTKAHIDRLLGQHTENGKVALRMLQTGSPVYLRAFGKALASKPLSTEEQRALSIGSTGNYPVPYTLDPTLVPVSNGSVNPYRAISRVVSITGNEWRGVTSAGVTAAYGDEVTEAGDNTPTLAQPAINVEKAQAFVPFSIETGEDWPALQAELAREFADAKDNLEAVKFSTGAGHGSHEPQGVVTGATTTVDTAGSEAFAVADVYALEEALPPRFRARAQWVANRSIYNRVRRFDTDGGADLWLRLPQGLANSVPTPGNTRAELIGYPANEASALASTVTADDLILVLGDFSYYVIVERIGMDVELIPHLFATANNRPSGQRGLYAHWRNSAEVLSANAFRVLKVASS